MARSEQMQNVWASRRRKEFGTGVRKNRVGDVRGCGGCSYVCGLVGDD